MARRPNYGAEKRQKELKRQQKREDKEAKKQQKRESSAEGGSGDDNGAPDTDTEAPDDGVLARAVASIDPA